MREQLGLDHSVPVRYFYWLKETAQGNLGYRAKTFEPVTRAIGNGIGDTLLLMGVAMTIGIISGSRSVCIAAIKTVFRT